jgi:hypothetical protein
MILKWTRLKDISQNEPNSPYCHSIVEAEAMLSDSSSLECILTFHEL